MEEEIVKKHRGGMKPWDKCTFNQKRHKIYAAAHKDYFAFWKICGRDRQNYYDAKIVNEDNVEIVARQLYDEYIKALPTCTFPDKLGKARRMKKFLGIKEDL